MSEPDISVENLVKSMIPDIAALTSEDISMVLNKANEQGKAIEVGDFLAAQRPDLEDEIEDAIGEALSQF